MATASGTGGSLSTGGTDYYGYYGTAGSISTWTYTGSGTYEPDHDGYIKVDKGRPDRARFVIFYAVKEKDPMIFCKTKKEVNKEIAKLMKREEVDKKSIRVFNFYGGIKCKKLVKGGKRGSKHAKS
jgi:hypothetical protein